jgi:predicted TIM-barrel fold metal-dependent hydrolase
MLIDYGSLPPSPEFRKTGKHLANYRRVYAASEEAASTLPVSEEGLAAWLALYDRLDAKHVVVKGKDVETTFGFRVTNEDVAAFCRKLGPRYLGFAGVDPNKGATAVRELEFAVRELGLRGLNLQCFEHKVAINDRRMFPLYAKCVELGVPVNIHVGTNFSLATSMELGRPVLLDDVMLQFPELVVCASPPGWPWVHELIAVAWRHPNVYIGVVAVRPKYLAVAGSGYEGLLQYGKGVLQDRMVFGSAFPMQPIDRAVEEIGALPLKDAVREKWLCRNAERLLGLV